MVVTGGTHCFDRACTLDALGRVLGEERGNWATRSYDLDGLGMHFTNANEWTKRDTDGNGTADLTLVYDKNGNLTDDGTDYDYDYEYDAWNRLTAIVVRNTSTLVAEYRYNGLGQRIAEGDGTDTEYLIYDDRWRLISRHDGSSAYLEETLDHHAGLDGYGGASDVDPTQD